MKNGKPTRRVTYFLDPDLIEDVKTLAKGCGQSVIVGEALQAFIKTAPLPKLKAGKTKAKRPAQVA